MISAGSNIQAAADPLNRVELNYLYDSLINPKPTIESKIRQLRIVRQMDPSLYVKAKKTLPYFVCAVFNPSVRKTENFAYTEYFVVDIDNLSGKQMNLEEVRSRIELDSRVVMSFVSPGEDGLKIMFRLKERCYDAGLYKVFYKEFVRQFSQQYHLEQVVDARTCDVCRACFVSIDADAFFHPDAETVDMKAILPKDNPMELFDVKAVQDKETKEQEKQEKSASPSEPEDDILNKIKDQLNLRRAQKTVPKHAAYVPERLNAMMEGIKAHIEDHGITVYEVVDIQYGKKVKCQLGSRLSELNIFYGKHGFSVVQSTKNVLSTELNEVLAELVTAFIDDNT